MKLNIPLALSALLVLVTACAAPQQGQSLLPFAAVSASQSAFYGNHLVISAARGGVMPLVVINSPFGASSENAIAAAMRSPAWAGGFGYRPVDQASAPGLRVVIAFDTTAGAFGRSTICRNPPAAQGGAGLRVVAAFCDRGEPLSIASATSPRPRSASDGSFTRLMGSISSSLFPIVDHSEQGR